MGTYKFVYRDEHGNDKKAFVTVEESATIKENLARVVPKAVERGILHPEASADNVLVELNGVRLNPRVPFAEAAPGMKDEDYIVVRYLASSVNLRLNFAADDPEDIRRVYFGRRRIQKLCESVAVSPSEPLGPQVEDSLAEIAGKYQFFGKSVPETSRFALKKNGKKLLPALSLVEQGIESDADVKVKPRIWFDWPPAFFNDLRGPYTGHAIVLALVACVIGLVALLSGSQEVPYFQVKIKSPFDCNVRIAETGEWIYASRGDVADSIPAGDYTLEIYQRERPKRTRQLNLRHKVRGGISESDRQWTEELPSAPDSMTGPLTPVKIVGYLGESGEDNIRVPVLVNGFKYAHDISCDLKLMPGMYSIEFELPEDRFISSGTNSSGGTAMDDFGFVVSDTIETTLELRYREEREEVNEGDS
ncbi:MAG: hypothetical protein GY838_00240 [bacterium]|nr:hypothetical protein [bacterium]